MIVLEGSKGEWICVNQGETYIAEDCYKITYEQFAEWARNEKLQEHGFRTPTINNNFGCCRDNGDAMRHAQYYQSLRNVAIMAAV